MHRCTLICVCQLNIWLNMNHNAYRLWLSYELVTFPFYFHSLFALWSLLFIYHHIFISITNEPYIMMSIHIHDVLMIYIHTCIDCTLCYHHYIHIVDYHSCYSLLWHMQCTFMVIVSIEWLDCMIDTIWMYPYHVICSSPFIYPFWLIINSIDNQ